MKLGMVFAAGLMLSACNAGFDDNTAEERASAGKEVGVDSALAGLAFETVKGDTSTPATLPVLRTQVLLDRLGFSPGVIDGKEGQSFTLALKGFQRANDLKETGILDDATRKALERWRSEPAVMSVRSPAEFANGPFIPDFPKDEAAQAKLPSLAYRNLMEALAERFHTDQETLVALNGPTAKVGAGQVIRVPAIPNAKVDAPPSDERGWSGTLARLGVPSTQPEGEKIVVDKSEGVLRVFGEDDRLIAQFPATMGSTHDPLPIGNWKVLGVSRNPEFRYNPDLFWDADKDDKKTMLPPGPNGPVGVVWIDLSKPHYGIHGTSAPESIGRAESHGCVRLTNWDAARVAQMVRPGTPVVFQE